MLQYLKFLQQLRICLGSNQQLLKWWILASGKPGSIEKLKEVTCLMQHWGMISLQVPTRLFWSSTMVVLLWEVRYSLWVLISGDFLGTVIQNNCIYTTLNVNRFIVWDINHFSEYEGSEIAISFDIKNELDTIAHPEGSTRWKATSIMEVGGYFCILDMPGPDSNTNWRKKELWIMTDYCSYNWIKHSINLKAEKLTCASASMHH